MDEMNCLCQAMGILERRHTPVTWYSWGLRVSRPSRKIRRAIEVLRREAVKIRDENEQGVKTS